MTTTLSFSSGKPLGFYSQSLQDKLYPVLGDGTKLNLEQILQLLAMASEGPLNCHILMVPSCQFMQSAGEDCELVGFDESIKGFLTCELSIDEWIALTRWLSELADIRLNDYKRALRAATQN